MVSKTKTENKLTIRFGNLSKFFISINFSKSGSETMRKGLLPEYSLQQRTAEEEVCTHDFIPNCTTQGHLDTLIYTYLYMYKYIIYIYCTYTVLLYSLRNVTTHSDPRAVHQICTQFIFVQHVWAGLSTSSFPNRIIDEAHFSRLQMHVHAYLT